ncbi:hypothetical protein [Streptomyces griseoloalbus]|uniref:Secreted protein n=1 Tax=Streptomyces griseoloalbus TaxID=67303 RepID=A0A7W8BTY6_9ACTN|nr:hypothetical protein [Streptomyces albaduncus]GGW69314.1 hypothetical protein GCM10010340_54330 [Streptomyces albaduncus]
MSWTRSLVIAPAVCVALLAGSAGCASRDARGQGEASPSPAGRLLDERDKEGRPFREVDEKGAPQVAVEVVPDTDGGWDVRLRVRNFRFSPDGAGRRAVPGRGLAHLEVNGHRVALLRTPGYHLSGRLVPRGTHHVTARLYADDGSVWAVDGEPVESTADITVSEREPGPEPGAGPIAAATATTAVATATTAAATVTTAAATATAAASVPVAAATVTGGQVCETGDRGRSGTRGSPGGVEPA